MLNKQVDRAKTGKTTRKTTKKDSSGELNDVLKRFCDSLNELERLTPPSPKKQFDQLLSKIHS